MEVSYVVPSASWSPTWDARLDAEKPSVGLSLYGAVQQSSGEDWSDVKLAVSTAQPQRGLYVPELSARYLDKNPPPPPPQPVAKDYRKRGKPGGVARPE